MLFFVCIRFVIYIILLFTSAVVVYRTACNIFNSAVSKENVEVFL